jgi:predicted HTH transcriptional regulator
VSEYPEFRGEAIVNAAAHRDYNVEAHDESSSSTA